MENVFCIFLLFCTQAFYCHGAEKNRILAGTPSNIENFPFQVSLARYGYHVCGGTIITDRVVISAGQCFYNPATSTNFPIDSYLVRAGAAYQTNIQVFSQQRALQSFTYFTNYMLHDIAIIILKAPLVWTSSVYPALLSNVAPVSRSPLFVSGWGRISSKDNVYPDQLQSTVTYVQNYCSESPRRFCTLNSVTMPCVGDAGSPGVIWDWSSSRYVLVGVVSMMSNAGKTGTGVSICEPTLPQQFTSIAYYREFLRPYTG